MRRTTLLVMAMVVAATLVSGVLVGHETASAQSTAAVPGTTITVNTELDEANTDGDCSLREAILAANTNAKVDGCKAGSATEQDAIRFDLGKKAKTIVLDSTLPAISDPSGLTITGQKAKITISGNEQVRVFEVAAGAELALSKLTVANGSANFGGGLSNSGGTVKVENTTFSNNGASNVGGGIETDGGTLTVSNSTFSNNSANFGGGLSNSGGTTTVSNSTFSENGADLGGGIFNNAGTVTLRNTIVANITSGGNCTGTVTDGGYNIDDGTTCGFSEQQDSLPNTEPLLADQLANNGGPTQTVALLEGSPAINAIPPSVNGCGTEIATDQRGVSRPQGSGCDIGAYEKKVRSK